MLECVLGQHSDVSVHYSHLRKRYICSGCILNEHARVLYKTPADMLAHIEEHIESGHKVPAYVVEELMQGFDKLKSEETKP